MALNGEDSRYEKSLFDVKIGDDNDNSCACFWGWWVKKQQGSDWRFDGLMSDTSKWRDRAGLWNTWNDRGENTKQWLDTLHHWIFGLGPYRYIGTQKALNVLAAYHMEACHKHTITHTLKNKLHTALHESSIQISHFQNESKSIWMLFSTLLSFFIRFWKGNKRKIENFYV